MGWGWVGLGWVVGYTRRGHRHASSSCRGRESLYDSGESPPSTYSSPSSRRRTPRHADASYHVTAITSRHGHHHPLAAWPPHMIHHDTTTYHATRHLMVEQQLSLQLGAVFMPPARRARRPCGPLLFVVTRRDPYVTRVMFRTSAPARRAAAAAAAGGKGQPYRRSRRSLRHRATSHAPRATSRRRSPRRRRDRDLDQG